MNILFLLKPKNTVSFLYDDYSLEEGLASMREHGYTAAPVLSHEGEYVGTVNEGDFLWNLIDNGDNGPEQLKYVQVKDILRENWNQPVKVSATVEDLLELVLNQNFVPVVDDRNFFVGIITRKAIIRYFRDRIIELKQKVGEK